METAGNTVSETDPGPTPSVLLGGGGAACSGEPGVGPALDSVGVLADVGVAELFEFGGDLAAVGARGVGPTLSGSITGSPACVGSGSTKSPTNAATGT